MPHRWKPGQSGNPQGGKITNALRQVMQRYHMDEDGNFVLDENGNKIKNVEAVARALMLKARKGDMAAISLVFERLDGKVPNVNVEVPVKPLEDMNHDELVQAIIGIADDRGTEADSDLSRAKPAGSA